MSPIGVRAMSKRTMREDWGTPDKIFDPLNAEFDFTLDGAATDANTKVAAHITPEMDSLNYAWEDERVWLNPPYGHTNLRVWMRKAYEESSLRGALVVCLVPAYTGQVWWHEWVIGKAAEIRWIKGKVKFVGADSCATFPSCIVIYRPVTAPVPPVPAPAQEQNNG